MDKATPKEKPYVEVITRRKRIDGKDYWFSSNSIKSDYDGKWSNTLYIHFPKENYPQLKYPAIIKSDWGSMPFRFDYTNSDIAAIDFHGGITFYEEMFCPLTKKTFVKAGCDYQHLWDEAYMAGDYGHVLIGNPADLIGESFEEIVRMRKAQPIEDWEKAKATL